MVNKLYEATWRLVFNVFFKNLYNVKIIGVENVPPTGPVIVAPNHLSNYDPPLVGCALTRHINFMAKEELFKNPIAARLITWLGAFPVRRGNVDKVAIRHAMQLLKNGLVLGIFPEGSRQVPGKLGDFHDGAASLAIRMKVPIVPAAIIGSEHMERGKVAILFDKPIYPEAEKATTENIEILNNQLKTSIQNMIDSYTERKN